MMACTMKLLVWTLSLAAALAAQPAAAESGVYLEEEVVKDLGGGALKSEIARTWLAPGRLRKEESASGTVTIAREDKKAL